MTHFPPVDEQLALLTRGIVDLQTPDDLKKKLARSLAKDTPLAVKVGFDPTAPDLHLGHTVLMQKMRQFQQLGHRVIFVIGDFTASIGDPTGKSTTRPPLTRDQIQHNAETYKNQVFKILDARLTEVRFNSEWLGPMGFDDVIRLAARYSLARMLERDDFQKRLAEQRPIAVHELLYPLAQAYDSVALKADVELGGTDQLFNLLVGRDIMRAFELEPQVILTTPILEGTDARVENGALVGNKMSKSLANYIGVDEPPREQFGKIMRICDALMWRYYDLLSDLDSVTIAARRSAVERGEAHPKAAKSDLAREIVARFHSAECAQAEALWFDQNIGNKEAVPEDVEEVALASEDGGLPLIQLLARAGLVGSNGEARRLIGQGGVRLDGERHDDPAERIAPGSYLVRAGKKKFARVVLH
ncbi:MAG: tyrosine--tRNA ligase [Pseudomonadota bacterium]